jgi:hypothetical protein
VQCHSIPVISNAKPYSGIPVLHPTQFHVNEAWIAFKLNDAPVSTGADGDFNLVALMDAASCFIVGTALVPVGPSGPTEMEAKGLLDEAQSDNRSLPTTLFISDGHPARILAAEAQRQGITVVPVPDDQLVMFLAEARRSFRERFGGGRAQ